MEDRIDGDAVSAGPANGDWGRGWLVVSPIVLSGVFSTLAALLLEEPGDIILGALLCGGVLLWHGTAIRSRQTGPALGAAIVEALLAGFGLLSLMALGFAYDTTCADGPRTTWVVDASGALAVFALLPLLVGTGLMAVKLAFGKQDHLLPRHQALFRTFGLGSASWLAIVLLAAWDVCW